MSVYTVPLGLAFSDAFASGFWARHAATPPERIARTRVLVNTPRMQRLTEDALLKQVPGSALLPRLDQLPALGADPLSAPDLPPAVDPLRRHLRLIRLVEAYLSAGQGETAPLSAAPALAEALETLLDECDEAGLPIDALEHATGGEHPAHWGRTLAFVDLVRRVWPEIRAEAEGGHLDPQDRQRRVVEAMTAAWEREPPTEPLIGAGSTGAVASTAVLLAAIARTPGGMVVLPGFDRALPEDVWAEIAAGRAPEHPQAPFAGLLGHLGLQPSEVVPWVEDTHAPARRALFRLALRPAPVTDAWQAAAPALAPEIEAATEGLTLIEAETPRQEA
ncbi:MAG: double-strand break repair protein AddB, partial [Pseudomonadota bacterium]